jgi:hypothetical protein
MARDLGYRTTDEIERGRRWRGGYGLVGTFALFVAEVSIFLVFLPR